MASDEECIKTIRGLAIDMVNQANSGHPGAPVGLAPAAHVLFTKIMNFDPATPDWVGRDRFVLSNGHASGLMYSILCLLGMLPLDEVKRFRQIGSKTPGHPEFGLTAGVEITTGPLSQGVANAVGMAMARAHLAAQYPGQFDQRVFVFCGDGCLQEGLSQEAASLAGHLKIPQLFVVYDNNSISIDGPTSLSYSDDASARFRSMGWKTVEVMDGNDTAAIAAALSTDGSTGPVFINMRTVIGFGTAKAGSCEVHGSPLGLENAKAWKVANGMDPEVLFAIPDAVKATYAATAARGAAARKAWVERATAATAAGKASGADGWVTHPWGYFEAAFLDGLDPVVAAVVAALGDAGIAGTPLEAAIAARNARLAAPPAAPRSPAAAAITATGARAAEVLAAAIEKLTVPSFAVGSGNKATRESASTVLHSLAGVTGGVKLPLFGGSADLAPSTLVRVKGWSDFAPGDFAGQYIRWGIREHGMLAALNGIAAYGGHVAFGSTFLVFLGYATGALRLSAISKHRVIFVGTHDSIGVGEDGPTHMPVELGAQVRAMPNALLLRPADGNEASAAYRTALAHQGPTVLALSRQAMPLAIAPPEVSLSPAGAISGAYTVVECDGGAAGTPSAVVLATGSEVILAVNAAALVKTPRGVRVVSVPDFDGLAAKAPALLPPGVPVIALEAWVRGGWDRYAHYCITLDRFGESGPAAKVFEHLGFSPEAVAKKIGDVAQAHASVPAPARVTPLW